MLRYLWENEWMVRKARFIDFSPCFFNLLVSPKRVVLWRISYLKFYIHERVHIIISCYFNSGAIRDGISEKTSEKKKRELEQKTPTRICDCSIHSSVPSSLLRACSLQCNSRRRVTNSRGLGSQHCLFQYSVFLFHFLL